MEENRILIKTNTTLSAKSFREMYFHYFFLRASSIIIIAVLLSYFVFAVTMSLYYYIAHGVVYINYIVLSGVFLLLIAYRPIQYFSYQRSANSNFPENKDPEKIDLIIIEGKILNEDGAEVFSLRAVRKVFVLKNIIYLIAPAKRILFLSREGFGEGEEEKFISYLVSSGIKVSLTRAAKASPEKEDSAS